MFPMDLNYGLGETATCRPSLSKWCVGAGVDIGFGGTDPIVPEAICIDRALGTPGRTRWNTRAADFILDAFEPLPFETGTLDYVFSSHALEDAIDTSEVLTEWCRIIRLGGYLVLFLPDQETYEKDCKTHGLRPNGAHKHKDFSLAYTRRCLPSCMAIVHEAFPVDYNRYSFELVARKITNGS